MEDAYTATIISTTGPITATLTGLDGLPTQTIPLFRLPGLHQGAITLNANLLQQGTGTVTIQVTSLTNPSITTMATADITTLAATATQTFVSSDAPSGSTYGQPVTFTATVSSLTGGGTPTGSVQFVIDGSNVGGPVTLVGGTATFTTATLSASAVGYSVQDVYTSNSDSFTGSSSTAITQIVNPAPLTITADNKDKVHLTADPAFTASYAGFVLGEGPANLGGMLASRRMSLRPALPRSAPTPLPLQDSLRRTTPSRLSPALSPST